MEANSERAVNGTHMGAVRTAMTGVLDSARGS